MKILHAILLRINLLYVCVCVSEKEVEVNTKARESLEFTI